MTGLKFMQIKSLILAIGLCCTLLLSCSTTQQVDIYPKWITSPYKVYSENQYMVAVGEGPTLKKAELQAIEALAAQFGRNISSSTSAASKMSSRIADGKVETGVSSSLSQDITQKVSVENLVGVEIKEQFNENDQKFYALAVLDKEKTQTIIESSVKHNELTVKESISYSGTFTFDSVSNLFFAKELAEINERYIAKLKVINPDAGAALEKKITTSSSVKQLLAEEAKMIPICITVENDSKDQVKTSFSKMLKDCGFNTSVFEDERYQIKATVSLERKTSADGKSLQCYYKFYGNFYDNILGESIVPFSAQGRETATEYSKAEARCYNKIVTNIETKVKEALLNYLYSI